MPVGARQGPGQRSKGRKPPAQPCGICALNGQAGLGEATETADDALGPFSCRMATKGY